MSESVKNKRKVTPYFYTGLRFKLTLISGLFTLIVLAIGVFGIVNTQIVFEKTKNVTAEQAAQLVAFHKVMFYLVAADHSFNKVSQETNRLSVQDIQKHNTAYRTASLRVEMFLSALLAGSETEAFQNEAAGIFYVQWQHDAFDSLLLIEPAIRTEAIFIHEIKEPFMSFNTHAQQAMTAWRKYLRLSAQGDTEAAEMARRVALEETRVANTYFLMTSDLLNAVIDRTFRAIEKESAAIEQFQRNQSLYMVLVTLAGLLITVLAALLFSTRVLVHPIEHIIKTVQDAAKGNLTKKITVSSNDEIAQLAVSFNEMTDSLNDLYGNLEQKVKARTQEVEKANSELEDNLTDLEKFHHMTINRELKMVELKKKIKQLENESKKASKKKNA